MDNIPESFVLYYAGEKFLVQQNEFNLPLLKALSEGKCPGLVKFKAGSGVVMANLSEGVPFFVRFNNAAG